MRPSLISTAGVICFADHPGGLSETPYRYYFLNHYLIEINQQPYAALWAKVCSSCISIPRFHEIFTLFLW